MSFLRVRCWAARTAVSLHRTLSTVRDAGTADQRAEVQKRLIPWYVGAGLACQLMQEQPQHPVGMLGVLLKDTPLTPQEQRVR